MQLTLQQRIFIVERYFRSFGSGRSGGASLKKVKGDYRIAFHCNPPTDRNILSIVREFRQNGCVNKTQSKRASAYCDK